jgi:hypothetical protein
MREFNRIVSAEYYERMRCLKDRRFLLPGGMWEDNLATAFEKRPRLEINKVLLGIRRIESNYRQNRISVDYVAPDGDDSQTADICDGLYRAAEQRRNANVAYDNAFREALTGGMGAWRLRALDEAELLDDYEEGSTPRLNIVIEPVYDADACVYFDADAKRQDKSDARRCWVLFARDRQTFAEDYPDAIAAPVRKTVDQSYFDWATPDTIYLAEYYEIERDVVDVQVWANPPTPGQPLESEEYTEEDFAADADLEASLKARGLFLARTKTRNRRRVHKYLLSGAEVIEDYGWIAGCDIPIIPVYGTYEVVDGIQRYHGHVSPTRDAQVMLNVSYSWVAENAATWLPQTPVMDPREIAGLQNSWINREVERPSYLLKNKISPTPDAAQFAQTEWTPASMTSPVLADLLQMCDIGLKDILGTQADPADITPSSISGHAVELMQHAQDARSFIYISNLETAMRRSGEVFLGMARDALTEDNREEPLVDEQGQSSTTLLNQPVVDQKTGKLSVKNDLRTARYTVVAQAGPSSSSRRAATAKAFTAMAGVVMDPQIKTVLEGLAMLNMEGEGVADARVWMRSRLVQMGVIQPTEEEQAEMAAEAKDQKPDPQAQYLLAAAENQHAMAQAKTAEAQADADLKLAQAEKAKADAVQVLQGVDQAQLQQVLQMLSALFPAAPAAVTPQ